MTLFILLPAFNEEAALRQLIPDLVKTLKPMGTPFTLCLVDDGSSDGTPALAQTLAREIPIQYLRHEKNQGYGAAIHTGARWVIQNAKPEDVLVTMDADNTQSPTYIPAMIQKLGERFDMVTASYTCPGGEARGVPLKRRFLSGAANTLLRGRYLFPGIGTYTNGFRAYRVSALQKAERLHGGDLIKEPNFAGGTELFIKAVQAGGRPGEIPFVLNYDRRGSGSKIRIGRTILGYLKLLVL